MRTFAPVEPVRELEKLHPLLGTQYLGEVRHAFEPDARGLVGQTQTLLPETLQRHAIDLRLAHLTNQGLTLRAVPLSQGDQLVDDPLHDDPAIGLLLLGGVHGPERPLHGEGRVLLRLLRVVGHPVSEPTTVATEGPEGHGGRDGHRAGTQNPKAIRVGDV